MVEIEVWIYNSSFIFLMAFLYLSIFPVIAQSVTAATLRFGLDASTPLTGRIMTPLLERPCFCFGFLESRNPFRIDSLTCLHHIIMKNGQVMWSEDPTGPKEIVYNGEITMDP
jgi:hypothetical protein